MVPITVQLVVREALVGESSVGNIFRIEQSIPNIPRNYWEFCNWISERSRKIWIVEDSYSLDIYGFAIFHLSEEAVLLDSVGFDCHQLEFLPKLPESLFIGIYSKCYRPRRNVIVSFLEDGDSGSAKILRTLGFEYDSEMKQKGYRGDKQVWGKQIPGDPLTWDTHFIDPDILECHVHNMWPTDVEPLLDIEYHDDNKLQCRLKECDFREFISRSDVLSLVVSANGYSVGSIAIETKGKVAEILHISIHPKLRRRGLASLLLEEAEQILSIGGTRRLEMYLPETQSTAQCFLDGNNFKLERIIRTVCRRTTRL